MDRGFVFSLIRTYMKDIATKIIQAGSVSNDSAQLWNLQVITLWSLFGQRFQYPIAVVSENKHYYQITFQIDFTRILCSHEHFVALNLPSLNPQKQSISETGNFYSGSSSPTPSVKSTDSQNSFVSHGKRSIANMVRYFLYFILNILYNL